ncbi:hypothetical protein LINPERHAP1_LOCUS24372 [Linum perenne]
MAKKSSKHNCDPLSLQLGVGVGPTTKPQPTRRTRRPRSNPVPEGKSVTIPPPYPWATDRRAKIHTMEYLIAHGLTTIKGEVECKRCNKKYEMSFELMSKFKEVAGYIRENKYTMNDRAPKAWSDPTLGDCSVCGLRECVKPVIKKRRDINWLFLLLGQWIGCCKLLDLKYFCKHTSNHRTGAKDRVLYLTYLALCKQLEPSGPFDV